MINEVIILSSLSNAGIVPFEGLYRADGTWERTYLAHAFDTTVREFLSARPDAERKRLVCIFQPFITQLALNSRRPLAEGRRRWSRLSAR
jgi:hypothetical protein